MHARQFSVRSSSQNIPLNWSKWIRQIHRWVSMIFAALVAAIFITLGVGKEPAYWVYLLPLFPLGLLTLTGLYMFVLPYAARWRGARRIDGQE